MTHDNAKKPDFRHLKTLHLKMLGLDLEGVSSFAPNLLKDAHGMRKTAVHLIDTSKSGLARQDAMIGSVLQAVDPKSGQEISQALEGGGSLSPAERTGLEEALREWKDGAHKAQNTFLVAFSSWIKELRDDEEILSESRLGEGVGDAFKVQKTEWTRLVLWSDKTLSPLMAKLGAELGAIDSAIKKFTDTTFFDDAVKLLPSKDTVGKIDFKKPEEAALKAGYEAVVKTLEFISGQAKFMALLKEKEELQRAYKTLKDMYDTAVTNLQTVETKLSALEAVHELDTCAAATLVESKKLIGILDAWQKELKAAMAADLQKGEFHAELAVLGKEIADMKMVWR